MLAKTVLTFATIVASASLAVSHPAGVAVALPAQPAMMPAAQPTPEQPAAPPTPVQPAMVMTAPATPVQEPPMAPPTPVGPATEPAAPTPPAMAPPTPMGPPMEPAAPTPPPMAPGAPVPMAAQGIMNSGHISGYYPGSFVSGVEGRRHMIGLFEPTANIRSPGRIYLAGHNVMAPERVISPRLLSPGSSIRGRHIDQEVAMTHPRLTLDVMPARGVRAFEPWMFGYRPMWRIGHHMAREPYFHHMVREPYYHRRMHHWL